MALTFTSNRFNFAEHLDDISIVTSAASDSLPTGNLFNFSLKKVQLKNNSLNAISRSSKLELIFLICWEEVRLLINFS